MADRTVVILVLFVTARACWADAGAQPSETASQAISLISGFGAR
jgi:hypothetical protein